MSEITRQARTFEAKFGGRCAAGCGEPVEPGDEVKWADDGQRERVVHAGCDLVQERALQPGSVCQECWTERSVTGACQCDAW